MEDRVRVDRQAPHDLFNRRQLISGPEDPETDCLPHLLHELQIRRDARAPVEVELDHRDVSSLVI
jgi:hypothetical protein